MQALVDIMCVRLQANPLYYSSTLYKMINKIVTTSMPARVLKMPGRGMGGFFFAGLDSVRYMGGMCATINVRE